MGSNLFPRKDYDVQVCSHRWGKQMTYCDNSDTIGGTNYMPLMLWYMRKNIRAGLFSMMNNESQLKMAAELEKCGVLNNSVYCQNGNTNQKTMDYNAEIMRETFKKYFKRFPSTYSYAGSDESYYREAAKYFNGARDNYYGDFGHPYTFYGNNFQTGDVLGSLEVPSGFPARTGFQRYEAMKHYMSIRWCDEATGGIYQHGYTVAQCIEKVMEDVVTTYTKKGFYNAFAHWHYLGAQYSVTKLQYKDYIDALAALQYNGVDIADNIHFCGFDEAFEYMIARIMLKKITCYTPIANPNEVHIVGYFNNDVYPTFRLDCLNTPLTIKVDLTGTPLAGVPISSNYGEVISLDNNQYLVELPAPRSGNITGIILSRVYGADYLTLDRPSITYSVSGSTITFATSTHKAKYNHFCIFRKPTGSTESNVEILDFKHNVGSVAVEKIAGYEYAVGVCANYNGHFKVSNTSSWV